MVRMPWTTYLWPGLPQLWHQGRWSGLAVAVAFAGLVNWLILASFVWVELLTPGELQMAWFATGVGWLGGVLVSARRVTSVRPAVRGAPAADPMFREAQREYLQEKWFEAERLLTELLRAYPRDVEGRLLLATLLRRCGRLSEAAGELDRLSLQNDAAPWAREINEERERLARQPAEAVKSVAEVGTQAAGEVRPEAA